MADMEERELTVTLGSVHKPMPLFNAAKVADKRITDMISDCVKLKLTRYLPDLRELKLEIEETYLDAAVDEAMRVRKELDGGSAGD